MKVEFSTEYGEELFFVDWYHNRYPGGARCRGVTECIIKDRDGNKVSMGTATCSRSEVCFDREVGRKVSLTRALLSRKSKRHFTRKMRCEFWRVYFSRSPKYAKFEMAPVLTLANYKEENNRYEGKKMLKEIKCQGCGKQGCCQEGTADGPKSEE